MLGFSAISSGPITYINLSSGGSFLQNLVFSETLVSYSTIYTPVLSQTLTQNLVYPIVPSQYIVHTPGLVIGSIIISVPTINNTNYVHAPELSIIPKTDLYIPIIGTLFSPNNWSVYQTYDSIPSRIRFTGGRLCGLYSRVPQNTKFIKPIFTYVFKFNRDTIGTLLREVYYRDRMNTKFIKPVFTCVFQFSSVNRSVVFTAINKTFVFKRT